MALHVQYSENPSCSYNQGSDVQNSFVSDHMYGQRNVDNHAEDYNNSPMLLSQRRLYAENGDLQEWRTWKDILVSWEPKPFACAHQAGPAFPLGPDAKEIDYFYQIFDVQLISYLVRATNRYAQQRRWENPKETKTKWYPVTVAEMKAFLGILIIMGYNKQPHVIHYWSTDDDLGNQLISKTMSRARYKQIMKYLSYSDHPYARPGSEASRRQKEAEKQDPLVCVKAVVERINRNSRFDTILVIIFLI